MMAHFLFCLKFCFLISSFRFDIVKKNYESIYYLAYLIRLSLMKFREIVLLSMVLFLGFSYIGHPLLVSIYVAIHLTSFK